MRPDGFKWLTVGHAESPVDDPLKVGMPANGYINRDVYQGEFTERSAIGLERFELWGREPSVG